MKCAKKKTCVFIKHSDQVSIKMIFVYKTARYQIFRGAGLGFPEELQIIVTGDVLQQGLSGVTVSLSMCLCKRGDV